MRICVFGAASPTIDKDYINKVEELGRLMAKRGHSLVFGGGGNGLMGAAARGIKENGGYILGVIPKFFREQDVEVIYKECDKLIEPDTMRERKQIMEDNADAFIVTPGGIGTFEEFFEILTSKQLCQHNKPIAIYNINGYYNDIESALKTAIDKNFIKETCLDLYKITDDVDALFEYIENPVENIRIIKELKDG
ncbi:MAG: TIGR00730 family Rossman fold protein [Ruminococcaceae bacterium]|nr:TIGR00730 family Rossman fold protein [Oscillospiraceae bacterium]